VTVPHEESRTASEAVARRVPPAVEALLAAVVVTGLVVAVSATAPERFVATGVGFVFLLATWALVWRKDDASVCASGLALGGLVLPGRLEPWSLARNAGRAFSWALGAAAIAFVPFYFGWRAWWGPHHPFSLSATPSEIVNEVFGQLVVIALPEEAFYRGYLQSRLDEQWPRARVRVLGADVGLGLLLASLVFALGHVATIHQPARFAVFFPALLFGWLRARTKGIGASVAFHAMCNLFSAALGRGYGLY
jgi:membrane protease YdiL (CAAX protease family)